MQKLRHLGEALIEESDHDKETTKDIKAQLQDFDDCWNQVAKRVIDEKEKVLILLILTVLISRVNVVTFQKVRQLGTAILAFQSFRNIRTGTKLILIVS